MDAASEKRIKRIVYCADQLLAKRTDLWATRYDRACKDALTLEELDEALLRIHAKHPQFGFDELVASQTP